MNATPERAPVSLTPVSVPRIHITDDLMRPSEAQEALRNYHEVKRSASVFAGKGAGESLTLGTEREFRVRQYLLTDTAKWVGIGFTLRAENEVANVWVETELDGTFSDEKMEELEQHILTSTPEGSFRPTAGIIENDNYLFGDPPDFDGSNPPSYAGNGKVDILMHDIKEGEDCCILGYVTTTDLNPNAADGEGNQADVLYIDLPDGLRDGVPSIAATIAHEYQHLIHYNYDYRELTFVNEGLSEWAEVVNGYFHRTIDFIYEATEHDTPLLTWRVDASVEVQDRDYQRAGLFTTYIADRIGPESTGRIVRAETELGSAVGEQAYRIVLDDHDIEFAELVADFHLANFANDRTQDTRFGYGLEHYGRLKAVPTFLFDGRTQRSSELLVDSLRAGAVQYVSWENVADLDLTIQVPEQTTADPRPRTAFRIYAEPVDGATELVELDESVTTFRASGNYYRLTLILINKSVGNASRLEYNVLAEWSEGGEAGVTEETLAYENGTAIGSGSYYLLDEFSKQASAFSVPSSGRLASVHVAPVYTNQFTDGSGEPLLPLGLPRDFRLSVWEEDGTGLPGKELYGTDVEVGPTSTHIDLSTGAFAFLEVDLPEDDPVLGDLPPTVYIGVSNIGADENHLVMTPAVLETGQNPSFLYHRFDLVDGDEFTGWVPFTDIEGDFGNWVLPIRARFLVPTAADEPDELPATASLEQNYPNPFNPTTAIAYSLPRPSHVRIEVYNMLGRRVATLVDGIRPAGAHELRVDGSSWASGVYLYTLESDGRVLTRRMVVLK